MKHKIFLSIFLLATVSVVIGFIFPKTAYAASLKELQDKLNQAQSDLTKYQSLQQNEHDKAQTYNDQIQKTQQEIQQVQQTIGSLQDTISTKEKDIADTSKQIDTKANELNSLSGNLNESLASYYELTNLYSDVVGQTRGESISENATSSEYMQSLQDQIISNIEDQTKKKQELETSRTKLQQQKNDLAKMKGEQETKNAKLNSDKQQKSNLLNKAKANEAQYQDLVKKLQTEQTHLSQQIYDLRRQLSRKNNEIYLTGTSGYPYSEIDVPDAWNFLTRECTSYAAWKWNVVYGRDFINTRPGEGHAYNWPNLARDQGYQVVSKPQVSAIISWQRGPTMPYGHVAIVEAVNADGTINVSEYNWVKYSFSQRQNVRYWDYGSASFIIP